MNLKTDRTRTTHVLGIVIATVIAIDIVFRLGSGSSVFESIIHAIKLLGR